MAILKLFPGIKNKTIEAIIDSAKGIVIESFGSGNAPNSYELSNILVKANKNGKILLNTTQCVYGSATSGNYQTSLSLKEAGVICGKDMTTEAAITKLMFLLKTGLNDSQIKTKLQENLRGEITS